MRQARQARAGGADVAGVTIGCHDAAQPRNISDHPCSDIPYSDNPVFLRRLIRSHTKYSAELPQCPAVRDRKQESPASVAYVRRSFQCFPRLQLLQAAPQHQPAEGSPLPLNLSRASPPRAISLPAAAPQLHPGLAAPPTPTLSPDTRNVAGCSLSAARIWTGTCWFRYVRSLRQPTCLVVVGQAGRSVLFLDIHVDTMLYSYTHVV